MSQTESIYLLVLCAGMLGAIALAFHGLKRMRAAGSQVLGKQRIAVYCTLTASAFMLMAVAFNLAATLLYEPPVDGKWRVFLLSLGVAVGCIAMTGVSAWVAAETPSAGGHEQEGRASMS